MTAPADQNESQVQRIQAAAAKIAETLQRPEVAYRLRTAPSQNEWSAMQVMGHVTEMLPYWLHHSKAIIDSPTPHTFGRALDDPERLAGVERGSISDPAQVISQLNQAVADISAFIRTLTPDQRAKTGNNVTRGVMSVDDIVEKNMVAHAEAHLDQVRAALEA